MTSKTLYVQVDRLEKQLNDALERIEALEDRETAPAQSVEALPKRPRGRPPKDVALNG